MVRSWQRCRGTSGVDARNAGNCRSSPPSWVLPAAVWQTTRFPNRRFAWHAPSSRYAPHDRPKRGNRLPIELIFDSFLVPSPVGLRATWQVGWQGLYRAGDCSVDLRIEPELKSARAAVIGQITNHVLPELEMGNLPVCLRAGKQVVAETVSNRFGEFQMEYDQQAQLKLCIRFAGCEKHPGAPEAIYLGPGRQEKAGRPRASVQQRRSSA